MLIVAGRMDAGKPEGRYTNFFQVGYNAVEFLLDFGQYFDETKDGSIHTRIVTNPRYAKELLNVLQESVERYEKSFGSIPNQNEEQPHNG